MKVRVKLELFITTRSGSETHKSLNQTTVTNLFRRRSAIAAPIFYLWHVFY